jgi:regulator of replication initiation timing
MLDEFTTGDFSVTETREILEDIRKCQKDIKQSLQEVHDIEQQLISYLANNTITALAFDIEMTKIRRVLETIRYYLRVLQRERTLALRRLSEID